MLRHRISHFSIGLPPESVRYSDAARRRKLPDEQLRADPRPSVELATIPVHHAAALRRGIVAGVLVASKGREPDEVGRTRQYSSAVKSDRATN